MQIQYLGTGASEGLPGVFCQCEVCAHARREGGKNIRRRCSVAVDKQLLIDLSPDIYSQSLTYKVDLSRINHVIITHTHYDHFYPAELRNLVAPYTLLDRQEKLRLYGSKDVYDELSNVLGEWIMPRVMECLEFIELKLFTPAKVGEYTVTPLLARHCPGAFIYLIELSGRVMLYGNDTGFFPEETWDYLAGRTIHLVNLDCNNPVHSDTPNHMTIEDCITVKRRLFQQKSSNNRTRYVATHFSHNGGLTHAQIDDKMRLHGITVAYDGLELRV